MIVLRFLASLVVFSLPAIGALAISTRDPTSSNLWPFELILWTALSALLFGGFLLARRLLVSKAERHDGR